MERIRAIIADDDHATRERVRSLLLSNSGVEIVAECASGDEALRAIAEQEPDLAFLSVELPGTGGLELSRHLPSSSLPPVVFMSREDTRAAEAFDAEAVDYLVKPLDEDRLKMALRRALQQVAVSRRQTPLTMPSGEQAFQKRAGRIAIRTGGKIVIVRTSDIGWVEAAGNYLRLHVGSQVHTLRETMTSFERRLRGTRFVRIHRSTIINLDQVKELQPWFGGEYRVTMLDGTNLTLSRRYRARLNDILRLLA